MTRSGTKLDPEEAPTREHALPLPDEPATREHAASSGQSTGTRVAVPPPGRRRRWLVAAVLAGLVLAAGVAYGLLRDVGIPAVVATDANVRDRPGASSERVGSLAAGEEIRVSCLAWRGEWARLAEPSKGDYVATGLLRIDGDPPACGG